MVQNCVLYCHGTILPFHFTSFVRPDIVFMSANFSFGVHLMLFSVTAIKEICQIMGFYFLKLTYNKFTVPSVSSMLFCVNFAFLFSWV